MPMAAADIERMIKVRFPDAEIQLKDLAGDNDHWAAHVVSAALKARAACSSIRWSTMPSADVWAAFCTPCSLQPRYLPID